MAKPAFTLRPSEKTGRTITKLAKEMGVTKNKLVSGFLDEAQPHMEEMLKALEMLNNKNPEGFSVLSQGVKNLISKASESQTDIIDLMVEKDTKKGVK